MKYLLPLILLLGVPQEEKTLRACWGPGPEELDPAKIETLQDARYAYALFEGLVTFKEDNVTPAPGLAEKWTVSEDGLTYTFTLRKATWSDGVPITASLVAGSWRRALDTKTDSPFGGLFERIKNIRAWRLSMRVTDAIELFPMRRGGVKYEIADLFREGGRKHHEEKLLLFARQEKDEDLKKILSEAAKQAGLRPTLKAFDLGIRAVNDTTLRVTLEQPTPYFLSLVGFIPFLPVPLHTVEKHGAAWTRQQNLVCSGPFVISDRTKKEITLARNEKYRDKPGPGKVVLSLYHEPAAALHLYRNDKIDWLETEAVPPEKIGDLMEHPDYRSYDTFSTFFVRFNTTKKQFSKAGVRRAFARAIDRKSVAEIENAGAAATMVPPGFAGYEAPNGLALDAKAAMRDLINVYSDPSTFPKTRFLIPDSPAMVAMAQLMVEGWEKAFGFKVEMRRLRWDMYIRAIQSGSYDFALCGWAGDYPDPQALLDPWVSNGPDNLTGWSNREYDDLIARASKEGNPGNRFALLKKAETLLVETEAPVVPVFRPRNYFMAKRRVKGLTPNLLGRFLLRNVKVD